MLKNTFADVRFDNRNKGSCQGGILSSLFFKLYIKGCIGDIVNHDVGCKIGLINRNVLVYTDDIVLMASSILKSFA